MHRSAFAVAALAILLSSAPRTQEAGPASALRLTSADIKGTFSDQQVLDRFGCSGGNVSPQLSWSGAPEGTKSFALTMFDPDAPTGSGWWHWVVVNIPPNVTELPAGASRNRSKMPTGSLEVRTDFGRFGGYGGPCPPAGSTHRYVFTVYALKIDKLDVSADDGAAMASFMIRQNSLANATMTVPYGRK